MRRLLVTALLILAGLVVPTDAVLAQRAWLLVPLPELEARAQRDSADPLAHYEVALGFWVHERYDDAERSLRRAVAIEPKTAAAYLALAYLPYARRPKLWKEARRGKAPAEWHATLEESSRFYRRAFMIDPMVDLKVVGLAVPPRDAIVVGRNATDSYAALVQGFESLWDGKYTDAYAWLEKLLGRFRGKKRDDLPDAVFWYHGLAAAHIDRHAEAVADFRLLLDRALERERTDSIVHFSMLESNEVRYVLATLLQRAGQYDEAAVLYEEALSNDLGLYMAHAQLANVHETAKRWSAAITERERALETNPEDPSLLYDLGTTFARARRWPEAAAALRKAAEANPANARIPYMRGQVCLQLGDRACARAAFERFVAIAPSRFDGQVTEARGKLAELR